MMVKQKTGLDKHLNSCIIQLYFSKTMEKKMNQKNGASILQPISEFHSGPQNEVEALPPTDAKSC
jgi:hypothetical protein